MRTFLFRVVFALLSFCVCQNRNNHTRGDDTPAKKEDDPNIYGLFVLESGAYLEEVTGTCFGGFGYMGVRGCEVENVEALEFEKYNISYTREMTDPLDPGLTMEVFCLQWPYEVSYSSAKEVQWNISCTDVDPLTVNLIEYELRLASKRWDGDMQTVSCPFVREGCTYLSGKLDVCDPLAVPYVAGYDLRLWIESKSDGEDRWRRVVGCEVEARESPTPQTNLQSTITLREVDAPFRYGFLAALSVAALLAALPLAALKFGRKTTCEVCTRQLWIGWRRCVMCTFVEADEPPPALMYMIENRNNVQRQKDWYKDPDDDWVKEMNHNRRAPKERVRDHFLAVRTLQRQKSIEFVSALGPTFNELKRAVSSSALLPESLSPRRGRKVVSPKDGIRKAVAFSSSRASQDHLEDLACYPTQDSTKPLVPAPFAASALSSGLISGRAESPAPFQKGALWPSSLERNKDRKGARKGAATGPFRLPGPAESPGSADSPSIAGSNGAMTTTTRLRLTPGMGASLASGLAEQEYGENASDREEMGEWKGDQKHIPPTVEVCNDTPSSRQKIKPKDDNKPPGLYSAAGATLPGGIILPELPFRTLRKQPSKKQVLGPGRIGMKKTVVVAISERRADPPGMIRSGREAFFSDVEVQDLRRQLSAREKGGTLVLDQSRGEEDVSSRASNRQSSRKTLGDNIGNDHARASQSSRKMMDHTRRLGNQNSENSRPKRKRREMNKKNIKEK